MLIRVLLQKSHWAAWYLKSSFKCSQTLVPFKLSTDFQFPIKVIMASNRYCIEIAKRGTAGCKECKAKIDKGLVRIAKILPNPFTENGGDMKQWFHVPCIFTKLSRAKAATKKIESTDDLEGWDELEEEHHPEVLKCLSEFSSCVTTKKTPTKNVTTNKNSGKSKKKENDEEEESSIADDEIAEIEDNSFLKFQYICDKLDDHSKYTDKKIILEKFFTKGSDGESFNGNLYLWAKMLLPAVEKRIYNLQNAQIIKIFSSIFEVSKEDMSDHLQLDGNISESVKVFFEQSDSIRPKQQSRLYLQDVDKYLEELSKTGQELEQTNILTKVAKKCTADDLKYFIRFIKHDLRIGAGPKHILEAIHPTAYEAFQASRDLKGIINRCSKLGKKGNVQKTLNVQANLMTPVLPMLAMACKDVEEPFKRYPNGFYVEVKYDGERVQIHKSDREFSYFSRSLKPVMPHKVAHLKDFIPKAFPFGNDLILDCEILLVDNDGKPLPFGTLGAHKKTAFKDASVCLFVFDCLQFNNESLMQKSLVERRKVLEDNMTPIKNRIIISELREVNSRNKFSAIVNSVIDQGLEGLVIKAKDGVYEPGKRHWLKLKKDYLENAKGQKMADSADLVVLGGYYGSGKKGGIMSVFLMGCYNQRTERWCTVTKVPGGDDATLKSLMKTLKMTKISKDEVPNWLNINKALIPDFVAQNPKDSPVWEISGAEFSKAEIHTASGISIRFPRVGRPRPDKDWKTATNLDELIDLFNKSKEKSELIGLRTGKESDNDGEGESEDNDDKNSSIASSSSGKSRKKKAPDSEKTSSKKMKSRHDPSKNEKAELDSFETTVKKKSSEDDLPPSKKKKLNSTEETNPKKATSKKSVLPDLFTGVKLYIPSTLEKSDVLRRYFIAYDGSILKEHESNEATHVICTSSNRNGSIPKKAERITVDWLWDSIKLKKRLSTKLYKPKS